MTSQSQFFWQNALRSSTTSQQQQPPGGGVLNPDSAVGEDSGRGVAAGWSNIGLNATVAQPSPALNNLHAYTNPYALNQGPVGNTDPYSAAVFRGYSASNVSNAMAGGVYAQTAAQQSQPYPSAVHANEEVYHSWQTPNPQNVSNNASASVAWNGRPTSEVRPPASFTKDNSPALLDFHQPILLPQQQQQPLQPTLATQETTVPTTAPTASAMSSYPHDKTSSSISPRNISEASDWSSYIEREEHRMRYSEPPISLPNASAGAESRSGTVSTVDAEEHRRTSFAEETVAGHPTSAQSLPPQTLPQQTLSQQTLPPQTLPHPVTYAENCLFDPAAGSISVSSEGRLSVEELPRDPVMAINAVTPVFADSSRDVDLKCAHEQQSQEIVSGDPQNGPFGAEAEKLTDHRTRNTSASLESIDAIRTQSSEGQPSKEAPLEAPSMPMSVAHVEESDRSLSMVSRERTHSPPAVAQVTPIVIAAPVMVKEQIPQQQQQQQQQQFVPVDTATPSSVPPSPAPSLTMPVPVVQAQSALGANVARVGPISSQLPTDVAHVVTSVHRVPPTVQAALGVHSSAVPPLPTVAAVQVPSVDSQAGVSVGVSGDRIPTVAVRQSVEVYPPAVSTASALASTPALASALPPASAPALAAALASAPALAPAATAYLPAVVEAVPTSEEKNAAAFSVETKESKLESAPLTAVMPSVVVSDENITHSASVGPPNSEMPKVTSSEVGASGVMQSGVDHSTDSTAHEENSSVAGSTSGHHSSNKKSVRERYRTIRQQYPDLMRRLDRHKASNTTDWRGSAKNPLSANATQNAENVNGRERLSKGSTPRDMDTDFKQPDPLNFDSMRASSKMLHSYTVPERMDAEQRFLHDLEVGGDDVVNTLRRSRFARAREMERAPSRGTKSEVGEMGPYRGPGASLHRQLMMQSALGYDAPPSGYPNYLANGRRSVGPAYGQYFDPYVMQRQELEAAARRRPQSSFDPAALSRYEQQASGRYSAYDAAYHHPAKNAQNPQDGDESSSTEASESDDEMAQINYQQQEMARRAAAMQYGGAPSSGPNEFYYFGVIQLSQERVQNIMMKCPPPTEYFLLPPIEKAAFLFFCALYRRHFRPVDLFHKRFNREFFNYTCEGDSSEVALWKICKHTQDEFNAKRSLNHLKAYEMSQKQLFSDDRETPDSRLSDRGSHFDREEDSDGALSVESALKEPLKFRLAHAFLNFGVGGKVLVLNPESSTGVVEVRDMKSLAKDRQTKCIVNAIESFRGPLIPGYTPTHSVRLFIQRQIERILSSDLFRENPTSGDVNDCLLVWQLLEMLVQQQGRVTGPDLSRLLMAGYSVATRPQQMKKSPSPCLDERKVDPRAYECFTQFLLGGHIEEAIESALRDGLYADALVLARRVLARDPQRLERIEAALLAHRDEHNPVMTLLSVSSGLPVPILTNPPADDSVSWRSHAAIILANLNSADAFSTIYRLGRVLSRREFYAAADFCYLAVCILTGYDPFQNASFSSDEDALEDQHISLIHASLPDDVADSTLCHYGFSLIDLHATEIFEFALRLANGGVACCASRSLSYQLRRLEYAELMSEYGSFATDSFRYCVEVARGLWERCAEVKPEQLFRLCDLADRLQFVASATPTETAWIPQMRSIGEQLCVAAATTAAAEVASAAAAGAVSSAAAAGEQDDAQPQLGSQTQRQQFTDAETAAAAEQLHELDAALDSEAVIPSTTTPKKPTMFTLGNEAVVWHAEHQEPLQMTPIQGSEAMPMFAEQQRTSSPIQQTITSTGGVSSSGRHQQHHILAQRRTSAENASGSAAHKLYSAFPPSSSLANDVRNEPKVVNTAPPVVDSHYTPSAEKAAAGTVPLSLQHQRPPLQQPQKPTHRLGDYVDVFTEEVDSPAMPPPVSVDSAGASRRYSLERSIPAAAAASSTTSIQQRTTPMATATEQSSSTTTTTTSSSVSVTPKHAEHQTSSDVLMDAVSPTILNDSVFTNSSFTLTPTPVPPLPPSSQPKKDPPQGRSLWGSATSADASLPTVLPNDAAKSSASVSAPPTTATSGGEASKAQTSSGAIPSATTSSLAGPQRHSSGFLNSMMTRIVKAIPSRNEMILPDDKHPTIVWDEKLGRYIGTGVEEERPVGPPPSETNSGLMNGSASGSTGGLTQARLSGASLRYTNPMKELISPGDASSPTSQSPTPMIPPVPMMTNFGFIPTMPDDVDGEAESPFSVDTSPLQPTSAEAQ